MQIRCPHCQVAIELIDVVAGSEVTCPKCGSVVSSADATFLRPMSVDSPDGDGQAGCGRSPTEPPLPTAGLPQDATPAEAPDEQRFGRFQLLKPLGKGSFGEVWLAHDPKLQRDVALKFPRPGKQKNFIWEAHEACQTSRSALSFFPI